MTAKIRHLGLVDYASSWTQMREFVDGRGDETVDELWSLEHPAVFTQGQGGRAVHIHDAGDIPIVQSDRGGQVTYHGPGQLVVYVLMDLKRRGIGPRELVRRIESGVIRYLDTLGLHGQRRPGAPGVYVNDAKVSALGLRIRRGMSYHGVALNVDLDLEPFSRIDPCGYQGLRVTSLKELKVELNVRSVANDFAAILNTALYVSDDTLDREHRTESELIAATIS